MNWQKQLTRERGPQMKFRKLCYAISAPPYDELFGTYVLGNDRSGYPPHYEFTLKEMVEIWLERNGGTEENAVLEIAERFDAVSPAEAQWMRRELSILRPPKGPEEQRPRYDTERGDLYFGNDIVRKVRRMKTASQLDRALRQFQELGWPARIDGRKFGDLYEVAKSLNEGLKLIRFRVRNNGIIWEQCDATS